MIVIASFVPSKFTVSPEKNRQPSSKVLDLKHSRSRASNFGLWTGRMKNSHARIHERTSAMLKAGFIDEGRALLARYPSARALDAVGYAQLLIYLNGESPAGRKTRPGLDGLQDEIELATRQLVKKQRTWFRSEKNARNFILDRDREKLIHDLEKIYA